MLNLEWTTEDPVLCTIIESFSMDTNIAIAGFFNSELYYVGPVRNAPYGYLNRNILNIEIFSSATAEEKLRNLNCSDFQMEYFIKMLRTKDAICIISINA